VTSGRSIGKWLLPQPKVAVLTNNWISVPKNPKGNTNTIPFGYKISEENPDLYEPIPEQLAALEKARQHLKRHTSRQVAAWLTKITGRYISHKGLLQRLRYEQNRRTKAATLRAWARRYKKAILLAEKEDQKIGVKKTNVLEEIGASKWGDRDKTFINLTTEPDGSRRVYKLCGCRCEHCSRPNGTEHNLQTEPGATDSVLSSQ
jgi:hypothetical protein